MLLIIDGHNLIPHIPGLSLSDPDDEHKLIKVLQDYSRIRQKTIEVYFDQAAMGQAGQVHFGRIKAVYVQRGMTADQAIMNRLKKLGKRARNVVVVSSDRQVQQAARAVHAAVLTSEAFSAEYQGLIQEEPALDPRSRLLSPDEVEMWERFFQHGHPTKDNK
jgi:predicted RNA-binding protein with PIN domain